MSDIFIHVFVSSETIDYFRYMVDNYNYLATGKIQFICYTYENDVQRYLSKYECYLLDNTEVPLDLYHGNVPAYLHYIKIKKCFSEFKKGAINIIADTDTVMLYKGWDIVVKDCLRNNYCVGPEYHTNWHYKGYPCFIWIAFSQNGLVGYENFIKQPFPNQANNQCFYIPLDEYGVKKYGCKTFFYENFTKDVNESLIKCNFDCEKYKMIMVADPCWDFPDWLIENNFTYKVMFNRGINDNCKSLNKNMQHDHVECWLDEKALLAHQLGGRLNKFKSCNFSKEFYNSIECYISNCIDNSL